jgi:hypothetical protein
MPGQRFQSLNNQEHVPRGSRWRLGGSASYLEFFHVEIICYVRFDLLWPGLLGL